jgi:hypothetical protein
MEVVIIEGDHGVVVAEKKEGEMAYSKKGKKVAKYLGVGQTHVKNFL